MVTIEQPPLTLIDVLAGYFHYVTANGTHEDAQFYVRCEPRPEDDNPDFWEITSRRQDAFNQQSTEAFMQLEGKGYKNLRFECMKPDPFF